MMHLTGPPRLNGLLLPMPSRGRGVEIDWEDESKYKILRPAGTKKLIGPRRLRGRIRFGYQALDPDEAYALLVELNKTTVQLVPRTRREGDPVWAQEVTLECRVTSPVPASARPSDGLFEFMVELETIPTYDVAPGLEAGRLVLISEDGVSATIQAEGENAAFETTTEVVTFMGEQFQITKVTPYPAPIAALRNRRIGPFLRTSTEIDAAGGPVTITSKNFNTIILRVDHA